jgi:hypothetical protein
MSNKSDTYPSELTIDEYNLLIEILLFSSSVNICSDWKEKDFRKMIKLAERFKNFIGDKINLSNISFIEEENYEDSWTKEMHNVFANHYKVTNFKSI